MLDWLNNMGDWNISRRRFYGLPLPFYKCSCGHVTVIGSKEELKSLAADPKKVDNIKELHRPWIDEITIKCPNCNNEVKRIPQVGDVWLDAGIVPYSTLKYFTDKEYWNSYFPAEYVIEAHEQIRLWFYSMLFMSTVLENKAPYSFIKTSGLVVQEDGTKFSKSGKNNMNFDDILNTVGADAIRFNYLGTNTSNDVRFGYGLAEEAKKKLLSYYNMVVFFNTYAEIDKPDFAKYKPDENNFTESDKWLIKLTDNFIVNCTEAMNNYETKPVIDSFVKYVDEVSNFYIRINRRRFWKSEDDSDKMNAYYVLFNSIKTVEKILAPMIPFMTEYIWQSIIKKYDDTLSESVHLSTWPKVSKYVINDDILSITSYVRDIITLALRARNESNIKVRQPLEKIYIKESSNDISKYEMVIKSELNVKNIVLINDFSTLKDEFLTLNFKNAGAVLKNDVNKVKDLLVDLSNDKNIISKVKNNESILIGDYSLKSDLLNIEFKEKDSVKIEEENGIIIALDITITDELKKEGILRDIIRQCQVFRKDAGFNVDDRIRIMFSSSNELINEIINNNKELLSKELLATFDIIDERKFVIEDEDYELNVFMKVIK